LKQDLGFFDNGTPSIDLALEDGDFKADNGLETAVLISLFTDRRVEPEELPPGLEDPRGWWGDAISEEPNDRIGSRIWTLDRGKITVENRNKLKEYALEALLWMKDQGIASKIETSVVIIQNERLDLSVKIYRPEGENIPFKFVWTGQELKRA